MEPYKGLEYCGDRTRVDGKSPCHGTKNELDLTSPVQEHDWTFLIIEGNPERLSNEMVSILKSMYS